MIIQRCPPAFRTSVVSRCKPGCCLPVLATTCSTRFRPIRQFGAPLCLAKRFDDRYRLHDRQCSGKRCRRPLGSLCATPVPTLRFNFRDPSSPVILPSAAVASPQSAQTLVPSRARSFGPLARQQAAKNSSPPLSSSRWHHPPLPSLSSVSLRIGPRSLPQPTSTARFNRDATSLPAYRRYLSLTMSPSQQRPSAAAGRNLKRVERVTDQLEKPSLDDRTYRVIRLPNKLEVLLVHDPDTDKASAAMDVHVGAFSDEEDMPGMAHAVEHVRDLPAANPPTVRNTLG